MGVVHNEPVQGSIEDEGDDDRVPVVNVSVANKDNDKSYTAPPPFDFNVVEVQQDAEFETEIIPLPETKRQRAGISWLAGGPSKSKGYNSKGFRMKSSPSQYDPQRHIGFYPTKHWYPPLDSNASQESEGGSREPPRNDKLGILHLIRYKKTPKDVKNMKSVTPSAPALKPVDWLPVDSAEIFKNGKISSETLDHIMEMVNLNASPIIGGSGGGSDIVQLKDEFVNYGYDPRTTHYFVGFIFLIYALILFVLFKFKVFRKIKVFLRG